jgi:hypothetical protein
MSSINYLLIQKDALKSYIKNAPILNLLGLLLTAIPLLIAFATYFTADKNRAFYYLAAVPLLLILIVCYYYFYQLSLNATSSKLTFASLKFHYNTFAHFIINQFLVALAVLISALPAILAGVIFAVALYNRILPYDKLNLSFNDFRAALSGIYLYFYAFLVVFLINLPFIFYTVLRVGFSGFYTIQNDSTSMDAIKENLADTQKVDYVNGFMALLAFLLIDLAIGTALVWVCNIVATGNTRTQSPQLVFILVPLILIPIFGLQLATMFKRLSQRELLI